MNVLLLSPSSKAGGAERAFLGLARRLPEHGIQPHVVLLQEGTLAEWLTDAGFEPVIIPTSRTRYVQRAQRTTRRIRSIVLERGAEAVVSNMAKGHVYGGSAALAARVPALWWQHEAASPTRFERAARFLPAAAVICVSTRVAEAQRKLTPRARLLTVNPGLPIAEIEAHEGTGAELRHELGWGNTTVVGMVGRLQRWKGHEVFLHAAAEILAKRPETRFAIVGGAILGWEGDYPAELERLTEQLGIGDRVYFAGHRPDPWRWTDLLDVAVHASYDEPFGLVLVEAMAVGTPLVSTAGPGPLEIVDHGRNGLLVPPGDAKALAGAVLQLLDDDALRARVVAGGRERARDYDESIMASAFAAALRSVVAASKPRRN